MEEEYKNYYFSEGTTTNIKEQLIRCYKNKERVKITYKKGYGEYGGYSKILEEIFCYIGKSTGTKPIFLDIRNKKSTGGGAILTNRIEKIEVY